MKTEFKNLITTAQSYLDGKVNASFVYGEAEKFSCTVKERVVDSRIREIAAQWLSMSAKAWPEGIYSENEPPEKISDAEFRSWVEQQLEVFEKFK